MAEKNNNTTQQDLGDLLAEKLKYHTRELNEHREQAEVHAKEADFHQERVTYISTILKDLPPPKETLPKKETLTAEEGFTKSWFWVKLIKQLAASGFLREEFTRGKLLTIAQVPNMEDKDYNGKVGYAASIALSELTKENFLSARKEMGTKGFTYKVKKIS